jgi:hypothetical protein
VSVSDLWAVLQTDGLGRSSPSRSWSAFPPRHWQLKGNLSLALGLGLVLIGISIAVSATIFALGIKGGRWW